MANATNDTATPADAIPYPEKIIAITAGTLCSTWHSLAPHDPLDDAEFKRALNTIRTLVGFRHAKRCAPEVYEANPIT